MKADNSFNSKLFNHTLPVREEVWEAIEKQLPPQEQERRLPIFWLILFASTILSGAMMFGFIAKHKTNSSSPVNGDQVTLNQPSTSSPSSSENLSAAASAMASDASAQTNVANALEEETEINSNNSSGSNSNSSSLASGKGNKENLASNVSSGKKENASSFNTGKNKNPKFSNSKSSSINKRSTPDGATKNSNSISSADRNTIDLVDDDIDPSNLAAGNELNTSPAGEVLFKRTSHTTSLLPLALIENLMAEQRTAIKMKKIKPDPSCYKFSGLTGGNYLISIDAFGGPGFSPRSFTSSASDSQYMQARKATESNQYAWSVGARVNLQLQSGLGFRLGLSYDQAGDVFDYTDTLATQSTTKVDSFFAADGTFLYADTNRILIFGTLIKKIHNTYRHLDIPLLVSYEMDFGRSTVMINAGPVFNLSSSYEGQILDPMLHPRSITPGAANGLSAYKTSLGLSFYLGAGAVFPLTDHMSVLVEPRYLYRIKPVTIKSYPLEEHRHFAGLNLGLRYFLD